MANLAANTKKNAQKPHSDPRKLLETFSEKATYLIYLSAKVLSTIIEDNILHLPFKTLSPFLRGGHPSYAKISLCRKRFCGRLTTQGMRWSNQAGEGGPFFRLRVKNGLKWRCAKWEEPYRLYKGGGGGVPSFLS